MGNIENAAQIGKMFVTSVEFRWRPATRVWEDEKYHDVPAHWDIKASLSNSDTTSYGSETMSFQVEQGIGEQLVKCLVPVIVADASRKAEQLAADSKAMVEALGDKVIQCLAAGVPDQPEIDQD